MAILRVADTLMEPKQIVELHTFFAALIFAKVWKDKGFAPGGRASQYNISPLFSSVVQTMYNCK